MTKRILIQLQLSNYDTHGRFLLECDSGYQMMLGRARVMLRLNPDLHIDILGAERSRLLTQPENINPDVFNSARIRYVPTRIEPNALQTRYDFDMEKVARDLFSDDKPIYDVVYINDPLLLRHFKALFLLKAGYRPKFVVHSHFVDVPHSPKFPQEASLWFGQLEASYKADYNFWQCQSALDEFYVTAQKWLQNDVLNNIMSKSSPWDDGYSTDEINASIDHGNLRFDPRELLERFQDKHVLFIPNRVGGLGRSSDYTQCGKFIFDVIPQLWKIRQDFVIIAGNPSQKILNHEITERCPAHLNILPNAPNRDEYRWLARHCDFAIGTYNSDTFGGTASRECLDLGALPLWVDCNEYASIAREVGWDTDYLMPPNLDMPDTIDVINRVLNWYDGCQNWTDEVSNWRNKFRTAIRNRCSYESTTSEAMKIMGL